LPEEVKVHLARGRLAENNTTTGVRFEKGSGERKKRSSKGEAEQVRKKKINKEKNPSSGKFSGKNIVLPDKKERGSCRKVRFGLERKRGWYRHLGLRRP